MKQRQTLRTEQKKAQGTILLSIQKISYSLKRKLLTIIVLTLSGIIGRAALQFVPSVEPITPLAILIGFLIDPISGAVSGISGFYVSNYVVFGGQGPWTIFQCMGAGIAGFVGGIFGGLGKKSRAKLIISTILGVTLYEIIVTISLSVIFAFSGFIPYIVASIPFSLVHISSSVGFSLSFYEFKKHIQKFGGMMIDKEILGLRVVSSSDNKSGYKLVPFLYHRISNWNDNSKHEHRFWYIKKDDENRGQ